MNEFICVMESVAPPEPVSLFMRLCPSPFCSLLSPPSLLLWSCSSFWSTSSTLGVKCTSMGWLFLKSKECWKPPRPYEPFMNILWLNWSV